MWGVENRMNRRSPQWLDIGVAPGYQRLVRPTGLQRYCGMLRCCIDVDGDKLKQVVLALLHMSSFKEGDGRHAWKSLPWTILDSLQEKGYISDPRIKTSRFDEGAEFSEELFRKALRGDVAKLGRPKPARPIEH